MSDNYNRDDDVPFRLPMSSDDDSSHSDDIVPIKPPSVPVEKPTRDENVITGDFQVVEDQDVPFKLPKSNADEVVDPDALTVPYDEDETSDIPVTTEEQIRAADVADKSYPNYDENYDDENDVPFKLPSTDEAGKTNPDERLLNRMVTMPQQNRPNNAPTLPGSGGLDPNPDFLDQRPAAPTIQTPRVQPSAPTLHGQSSNAQYQRPTQPAKPPVNSYSPPNQYNAPAPPTQQGQTVPGQPGGRPLPGRKRKRAFNPGCLAIFLGLIVTFCGGFTCVSALAGVVAYARIGDLLEERIAKVEDYQNFQSTFLYDRNGQQLFEVFGEGRRTNVDLEDMPQHLINATIATEDDEFYTNIGIDIPATTVSVLGYIGINRASSGGSTITQQLVRNVLFDPAYRAERSATRKAEEIFLAIALTQRMSKDNIMEMYLNEIYYGNLAYGAQAAAQVFFGKNVGELTLGEAALLAGLPQAPAELNPLDPDPNVQSAVERRWRYVLDAMVDEGYITAQERTQALSEGLSFSTPDVSLRAPHFTVYAQGQLENLMERLGYSPEAIALGGLQVYTTVDLRINDMVQTSIREQVAKLTANNVSNGAVVVMKPLTGEIMAMVGSADYNNDDIDGRVNVTTSLRQPGSTIKALMFAAAIERGMTPGDIIWDTRTVIGIPGQPAYEPRNYDGAFHGPMRMREALANSYNIPAIQVLRHVVDVNYFINFLQRHGVTSLSSDPGMYGLSITLGGAEVSPLEMTAAFASFANQGSYVEPQAILCVLDNDDNIIYQYENGCPRGNVTPQTTDEAGFGRQVHDPRIAYIMSDILSDNVARSPMMGSNSPLNTGALKTAVKTGTTDNVKDNWTIGYTRNVAVGVWVGNSNGDPMVRSSGLTGAAPIWNQVITSISNNQSFMDEFAVGGQLLPNGFEQPSGVSWQRICDATKLIDPAVQCASEVSELMLDTPAGIPNAEGILEYPPINQQPPIVGDTIFLSSPGVYTAVVEPIAEGIVQFPPAGPGQVQPPSPRYCRVPIELVGSAPAAREQLFIAPPPDPADAAQAEHYARARNLAILPTIQCTPELLGTGGGGPIVITAVITQPTPGQVLSVTAETPILGTVNFAPDQAAFYKLEIRGGQFPNWTTLGTEHYNPVVNGQLENLYTPALIPGSYELRLAVIGHNAQPVQAPYVVPFTVQ